MSNVVLGLFVLAWALIAVGAVLGLLWRLALQAEGVPMPKGFHLSSSSLLGEMNLTARLLRRSGEGAGERYRRAARVCFILASFSLIALVAAALLGEV